MYGFSKIFFIYLFGGAGDYIQDFMHVRPHALLLGYSLGLVLSFTRDNESSAYSIPAWNAKASIFMIVNTLIIIAFVL